MILIFAVDKSWDIGFAGGMLAEIRQDLKRFRELTEGNIIIMGRRTLEAIPGNRPLPNRINILITKSHKFHNKGFYIIDDINKIHQLVKDLNPKGEKKVFVTGGESVVRQLIPYCRKAYITKILKDYPDADTSIPNLDMDKDWEKIYESEVYYQDDLPFKYVNYTRRASTDEKSLEI